jgi:hypothetical protein
VAKADPYRLSSPTSPGSRPGSVAGAEPGDGLRPDRVARGEAARALLWTVLVAGVLANMAASYGGAPTSLHLACGVVTAIAAGTLAVRALRGRGQR